MSDASETLLPAATTSAVDADAHQPAAAAASASQNASEAAVEESVAAGPLPPVQLGPRLFESRNQCAHWLKDLLARVPADSKLEGANRAIVEAVLRAHHKSAEKIGCGLAHIWVDNHPEHQTKCFMLERTDGTKEDFSYVKTLDVLFPGQQRPARPAGEGGEGGALSKRGRGGAGFFRGGRGGAGSSGSFRGRGGRGGRGGFRGGRGRGQ